MSRNAGAEGKGMVHKERMLAESILTTKIITPRMPINPALIMGHLQPNKDTNRMALFSYSSQKKRLHGTIAGEIQPGGMTPSSTQKRKARTNSKLGIKTPAR